MRTLCLTALFVFVFVCGAANGSGDPNCPREYLRTTWDEMIFVLSDPNLSEDAKKEKIVEIGGAVFDFPLMAKLSLGKKNWICFSKQQRETFTSLFTKRLKDSYGSKMLMYTGQKISFGEVKKRKKTAAVPVTLKNGEEDIMMLYKLRIADAGWRVYDVEVEGVSILKTYRSQFSDILSSCSVEEFLVRMNGEQEQTSK